MKKMKYFLMGAGTVIAGLATYVFFKEPEDNYEINLEKKYDVTDVETNVSHSINSEEECAEYRNESEEKEGESTATDAPAIEPDETEDIFSEEKGAVLTATDVPITEPDETEDIFSEKKGMKPVKQQVLIIHNNEDSYRKLKLALESITITVEFSMTLDKDIRSFTEKDFCLVIVDASVSETEGQQILKVIQTMRPVPMLFLSSNTNHTDRIDAFKAGVSAYLGKPYSLEECVAQIKSLLRLYEDLTFQGIESGTLIHGENFIINPLKRTVVLKDKPVKLTRKEFDLLYLMASHPGQVFTREQLYRQIWNTDYPISVDDSVKTHIKTLRKKLLDIDCIQNVWGVGYCFNPK